jgi:hypothetical protein
MSKTGIEKSVKLFWVVGYCIWVPMVAVLWWHGYEAQTAAQASFNMTRLETVSVIGVIWSVAGAAWLAKLRKTRKN